MEKSTGLAISSPFRMDITGLINLLIGYQIKKKMSRKSYPQLKNITKPPQGRFCIVDIVGIEPTGHGLISPVHSKYAHRNYFNTNKKIEQNGLFF